MTNADRSKLSRRAALFIFIVIGIPSAARSATLEESAKALARRIVAALPARESVQYEIRNTSSLKPEEVARVAQALDAEFQDQGLRLATNGAAANVAIALSENWDELVWTAIIHQGDESHTLLMAVPRTSGNRAASAAMPVTIRAEKMWEGPQRILDAGRVSYSRVQSWLVLLLPDGVVIQEIQDGSTSKVDVAPSRPASREPMGSLGLGETGNTIWFSVWVSPSMRFCKVDLEAHKLSECLPQDDPLLMAEYPMMIDAAPPGLPPPGKGMELVIPPVCGGTTQFLASGNHDDTEPDSLQVFEAGPNGPVAISMELDFPGPIVALHTAPDAPRAIVRNLTTGNYEAYRLAISCGQ